ncbi:MAG: alpha/beta hydrolase [Hyphomicrobiaceae bacterium]
MTDYPAPHASQMISGGRVGFLLLHGLGGTPVEVRYLAFGLARQGYTVHCPLLAGHGGGIGCTSGTGWRDWYASVEAAHDELLKVCDVVIVGGLSAGSILALELALNRPRQVHGITLYAPTLWPDGWSVPWYAALFKLVWTPKLARWFRFVEREPYGIKDERVRSYILRALAIADSADSEIPGYDGTTMLELKWLVKRVKKRLHEVTQPVLICHSRDDDQSDVRNAFWLQRRLGGIVDTCILDDSYHMVTVDRQRGLVLDRTHRFAAWLESRHAQPARVQPARVPAERQRQEAAE